MPIHIIWGDDINACNKEIDKIINNNVSKDWKALNISRFNGEDHNQVLVALEETQSPPMGDGSRIVILNNNPIFNCNNQEFQSKFEIVANNLPKTTYLILKNTNKPDARIKSTKLLKQMPEKVKIIESDFNVPNIWNKDAQINYVKEIAKNKNIKIEQKGINYLIDSIGLNSSNLNNELDKAKLYLNAKNNVHNSAVTLNNDDIKAIFNDHQSTIFKILDYLLEMSIINSLFEIHNLLNQGEPPLRLTAGLISQMRIYTIVKLLNKDQDSTQICALANISNPKRIFFMQKKVRYCKPKYLINVMIKLLNIEALIKRGNNPKDVFTENLMTLTS